MSYRFIHLTRGSERIYNDRVHPLRAWAYPKRVAAARENYAKGIMAEYAWQISQANEGTVKEA